MAAGWSTRTGDEQRAVTRVTSARITDFVTAAPT